MRNHRAIVAAFAVAGLAVFGIVFYGCGRPPQMGADPEVFRTVDALYTAITARNEKLLSDCEGRLQTLEQAGKLPSSSGAHLKGIIGIARQGRWQAAAERLYRFMEAQRRDAVRIEK